MPRDIWEDQEAEKNFENVFNSETLRSLYELADDGHFQTLHGFVKQGKESNVCVATTDDGEQVAVKIYVVEASNYEDMTKYLLNDPRFQGISDSRRDVIFAWCRKEYKNLMKVERAGVDAPRPRGFEKNVLVMDFLGEDFSPAPRLKDVELHEPEREFDHIIDQIRKLWQQEELVHGDLSEYNVLWHGKPQLIDFSQGVLQAHPLADELLERDLQNLANHFEDRYGLERDMDDLVGRIKD